MSEVTVKELAKVVGTPVDKLIVQFHDAGIEIESADQVVNDEDKQTLLEHLRRVNASNMTTAAPQKITLKRKSTSQLKVSSGKSRGSVVNVEVRKKRTYVKRSAVLAEQERQAQEQALEEQKRAEELAREEEAKRLELEAQEAEAKAKADAEAAEAAALNAQQEPVAVATESLTESPAAEQQAKAEPEIKAPEETPEEKAAREEAERQAALEEAKKKAEEEERLAKEKAKRKNAAKSRKTRTKERGVFSDDDYFVEEKPVSKDATPTTKSKKGAKSGGRANAAKMAAITKHGFAKPVGPVVHEVAIGENIQVSELAQKMSVKATEVIKVLMRYGTMATVNQMIDQETAVVVVEELGHKAKLVGDQDIEDAVTEKLTATDAAEEPRPAVVTIMGHVDHGKTSLLDYIRSTQVVDGEAGGITQHIGAYKVKTSKGDLTFLDTPGHAAFTAMRARGSQCTDIVVLVVAADDGVMPQTEEAIQHAKAAGVPLVVAVNKMDKPEADPERVKTELSSRDVIPEDWGGNVQFIPVSAKTGEGVDALLEAIGLESEMAELKAPKDCPASGVIVEARLDKGRGPVATILVQRGTLRKGDVIIAGQEIGKVRALLDENSQALDAAGPSVPAEVLGLSGVPGAGDTVMAVEDERKARELATHRKEKVRAQEQQKQQGADPFALMGDADQKHLNIVLKADVHGSVEAITESVEKLSRKDVTVNVIYKGVGGINESDVQLAKASNAIMVGFNVRADATAKRVAEQEGITMYYYSIIYELIDEITKSVKGLVAPEVKEQILGIAQVRDVFRSSKFGAVAGCMIIDGVVKRNKPIRVLRDNVVIYEGELESLRRFKEDVSDVRQGMECGIGVKDYNDVKVGDQIENFEKIEVYET